MYYKKAAGKQPTYCLALHHRQRLAGEGSAFPKTQSPSNLYLTEELNTDAWIIDLCSGDKKLRSACYMLHCGTLLICWMNCKVRFLGFYSERLHKKCL